MPRELGIVLLIAGVVILGVGNLLYLRGIRRANSPMGAGGRPPLHYALAGLLIGGTLVVLGFLIANAGTL